MFRLLVFLGILVAASAFSDVNQRCIDNNKGEGTTNNFLIGKWYKIYEFLLFSQISSPSCPEVEFTNLSAEKLQEYRNKYNSAGLPFTIEENPILRNDGKYDGGLISGNTEAKFFVLDPESHIRLTEGYAVDVYRRISDDYVLFWECSLRGHRRWLLARNKNATQEEILQVIASIPDVKDLRGRRMCT